MTNKKHLLEVKKTLKRRQPTFRRQQAAIRKKLKDGWRKPRGLHSKMKDGIKGHPKSRRMGYRTPVAVRGMTAKGLIPVRIERPEGLAGLDPKTHAIVLGKIGGRKKVLVIEQAVQAGFTLVNASAEKGKAIQALFVAKADEKKAERKEKETKKEKAARIAVEKSDAEKKEAAHEGHDHKAHEGHDHKEHADHDHKTHDHAEHVKAETPKKAKKPAKKAEKKE